MTAPRIPDDDSDCLAGLDTSGLEEEFPQAEIAQMRAERFRRELEEVTKQAAIMAYGKERPAPLVGKQAVFGRIVAGLAPDERLSWWAKSYAQSLPRIDVYLSIEVEVPGVPVKAIVGAALIESRNWPFDANAPFDDMRPGLHEHCGALVARYRDVTFVRRLLYMLEQRAKRGG